MLYTLVDLALFLCLGVNIFCNSLIVLFVFVPWSKNGVGGCDFCKISTRSSVALANLPSEDVLGICTCSGKNSMVSVICSPLVTGM